MKQTKHPLRYRQIHLDFHTSPHIPGIGAKFNKKHWQKTLQEAAVDSITLFSKCHHGWSYHPTKVGKIHPHLNFDLLRKQYDATKEIGINAPIYLSAGFDQMASDEQPGWREIDKDGPSAVDRDPSTRGITFWILTAPTSWIQGKTL